MQRFLEEAESKKVVNISVFGSFTAVLSAYAIYLDKLPL